VIEEICSWLPPGWREGKFAAKGSRGRQNSALIAILKTSAEELEWRRSGDGDLPPRRVDSYTRRPVHHVAARCHQRALWAYTACHGHSCRPASADASPGWLPTNELCVFDLRDWILDVDVTVRYTADVTAQSTRCTHTATLHGVPKQPGSLR